MASVTEEAELGTCAEEMLWLLGAHGVEVLFLNPGTDSAPLQEAAAVLASRRISSPRIVLCSFESVALAAAHGYFQVTRRPQAVFVHVDVGTQNLGAMVHNVLRDRAGVVIVAGKTPYGEAFDDVGGRSSPINWQQDVADQAGIVRPYAKWTTELTRSEDTARVVGRATQVACGGIPGLSYLTVSRDVLMEPAGDAQRRRLSGWARPAAGGLSPTSVARIADILLRAERPLLITTRIGRTVSGSKALTRLADVAVLPVVGRPEAVNLPGGHPLWRRDPTEVAALIRSADAVLLVEVDVPWIPKGTTPPADAIIIHIDPDPIKIEMPLWTFPVDESATADGATALAQIADAFATRAESADVAKRRRAHLGFVAALPRPMPAATLEPDAVVSTLNAQLRGDDIVVEEAVSNSGSIGRLLDRHQPGTLHSAGGPGLGWALGASVGIKLAAPARRVVAVVGDGAFMFGVPTAAFCLAAEANAPFLTVILNNNGYRASRLPVLELFPVGESVSSGSVIGTRFAAPPDLAAVARACGAWAQRVEDAQYLAGTLREAFVALAAGRCAVVDVSISQT